MQLRDVIQRSLGHSNQKLWPKVDFGEFHHVYPLEHFKSCSTDRLWVYNAEIFFLASFDHIKSAVRRTKPNSKKKFFSGHPIVHLVIFYMCATLSEENCYCCWWDEGESGVSSSSPSSLHKSLPS